MRSKEEILKDAKCCIYGTCGDCSHNSHSAYECEAHIFNELMSLIENYETELKTKAKPTITEDDLVLAHSKGVMEAWELATAVADFALAGDMYDILGEIRVADALHNHTPADVKVKIEKWKNLKSITVGDEIIKGDKKAVILDQYTENQFYVFNENGCVTCWTIDENVAKTGKHVNLDELFK